MLHNRTLASALFFLLCFTVPIQLNKFFWPPFSYVGGIRVDYLAPTIYLSDIFILSFVAVSIFSNIKDFKKFLSKSILLPLFLLAMLTSTLFASNFDASSYLSLKAVEMILLVWSVKNLSFTKKTIGLFIAVISFSALIQSIIGISQFLYQKSLGGAFYFLGERNFNAETIGVATFHSAGQEVLRSYATFPHPNVFALFLSASLIFVIYTILKRRDKQAIFYSILSLPLVLALLLTFSRVTIALFFMSVIFLFFKSKKALIYSLGALLILGPLYLLIFSGRFLTVEALLGALNIRTGYITEGFENFAPKPIFGLGLNNTFFETSNLPIYARFQPVHNVYLHLLFQIGIVGIFPVIIFVIKVIRRIMLGIHIREKMIFPMSILAGQLIIVSLFDHFPVTLHQGMLISAIILGLLFNDTMERVSA